MAVLRRADLIKLWNGLVTKLTEDDVTWLKVYRSGAWETFTHPAKEIISPPGYTSWQIEKLIGNVYDLSFRIQDIVDVKFRDEPRMIVGHIRDRKNPDYFFAEGMPKVYLAEIAKLFGIVSKEIDSYAVKMNKWQLVNVILETC